MVIFKINFTLYSDYDVNQKLKLPLKGKRFQHLRALKTETDKTIIDLNNNNKLFGTLNLPKRWRHYRQTWELQSAKSLSYLQNKFYSCRFSSS